MARSPEPPSRGPSPVDYERNDTLASLTMGTGSLGSSRSSPGAGQDVRARAGTVATPLLSIGLAAAAATAVATRSLGPPSANRPGRSSRSHARAPTVPPTPSGQRGWASAAPERDTQHGVPGGPSNQRQHGRRRGRGDGADRCVDLGRAHVGPAALPAPDPADLGKRTGPRSPSRSRGGLHLLLEPPHPHERRFLWAIHVVHHSSERYNLSTALRHRGPSHSAVRPYGLCPCSGCAPNMIETAARSTDLPVLDPHRRHPVPRPARGGPEHAVAPPAPPRQQPPVPRPQTRLDPDHLGHDCSAPSNREGEDPVVYGLNEETSSPSTRCGSRRTSTSTSQTDVARPGPGRTGCRSCCADRVGPTSADRAARVARPRRSRPRRRPRPPDRPPHPPLQDRPGVPGRAPGGLHLTHCQNSHGGNHAHRCRPSFRGPARPSPPPTRGSLTGVDAWALSEVAMGAAVERFRCPVELIEDIGWGESMQGGGNVGRYAPISWA